MKTKETKGKKMATVVAPKKKEMAVKTQKVVVPKKLLKLVKKVEKPVVKKTALAEKQGRGRKRSKLVIAILEHLDRRKWVFAHELVAAVGKHISREQALKVQAMRAPALNDEPESRRVTRGKKVQVMLSCITLVQHEKIEQRGRGDEKQYRLI